MIRYEEVLSWFKIIQDYSSVGSNLGQNHRMILRFACDKWLSIDADSIILGKWTVPPTEDVIPSINVDPATRVSSIPYGAHVWEHLTYDEGIQAAKICCEYLKPGGYIRCAVPDALFPNEEYQNIVKIGGPGPKDHPIISRWKRQIQ
jgi:hypothetical protein